jgi:hypothetical protein
MSPKALGVRWARSRQIGCRPSAAQPPSRASVPSTRIEGSKLSDREVEQLLSNLEIKSFASRDEQEVGGYAELVELVFSSWQDISFGLATCLRRRELGGPDVAAAFR